MLFYYYMILEKLFIFSNYFFLMSQIGKLIEASTLTQLNVLGIDVATTLQDYQKEHEDLIRNCAFETASKEQRIKKLECVIGELQEALKSVREMCDSYHNTVDFLVKRCCDLKEENKWLKKDQQMMERHIDDLHAQVGRQATNSVNQRAYIQALTQQVQALQDQN